MLQNQSFKILFLRVTSKNDAKLIARMCNSTLRHLISNSVILKADSQLIENNLPRRVLASTSFFEIRRNRGVARDVEEEFRTVLKPSLGAVDRGRVALVLIHNSASPVPLEPPYRTGRTRENKGASGKGRRQSAPSSPLNIGVGCRTIA